MFNSENAQLKKEKLRALLPLCARFSLMLTLRQVGKRKNPLVKIKFFLLLTDFGSRAC